MDAPGLRIARGSTARGGAGVSGDVQLLEMYQGARRLRIADGPDDVRMIVIARNILKACRDGDGRDFGN